MKLNLRSYTADCHKTTKNTNMADSMTEDTVFSFTV